MVNRLQILLSNSTCAATPRLAIAAPLGKAASRGFGGGRAGAWAGAEAGANNNGKSGNVAKHANTASIWSSGNDWNNSPQVSTGVVPLQDPAAAAHPGARGPTDPAATAQTGARGPTDRAATAQTGARGPR
jgi:hypothetical protein